MLSSKAVDKMTDHRIDMAMLAIVVISFLFSSWASLVALSDRITIFSSYCFVTSSGKTAKMPSP